MKRLKKASNIVLLFTGLGFTYISNATTYSWVELPTLNGYESSYATKLNDLGQVVGFSKSVTLPNGDATIHATLWSNGLVSDLGTLGGANTKSMALGINNAGQIVGASNVSANSGWQATLWDKGSVTNLGSLAGYDGGEAISINNSGQIVGISDMSVSNASNFHATLWSNGSVVDLGTLGGNESQATSINDNGQIVGDSTITVNGARNAVMWNLDPISSPKYLGVSGTTATDINNSGQVVGMTGFPGSSSNAILWEHGLPTDLGALGPPYFSASTTWNSALSINDAGYVVGYSQSSTFTFSAATIWSSNTGLIDLNRLLATSLPSGSQLAAAYDINSVGQILAFGSNGYTSGYYILTPSAVPIPSAAWLMASGLGLLSFTRRKQNS